jgi:hypothetical protein
MSDIYADENLNVLADSEIGESGPGVFAPDAHRLAGLDATHHHDAEYGLPDTTVMISEDPSGLPLSCSHGGRSYVSGETAVVPVAVAAFWVRSGWAIADLDADDTADHGGRVISESDGSFDDGQRVAPPVKSPARSKSTAAGTGRRKS